MSGAKKRIGAAAAAALACLSGCGGNDDAITAGNVADKLASAYCASAAPCCEAEGLVAAPRTCQQFADLIVAAASASVTGSTMFNADVAAECIKAAQDYNCWSSTAVRNVCGLVVSGTVPIGGSCRVDTECAQSPTHAVCLGSPGQCTADSFFGRAGAPCAGFALDCATYEGLRCITGAQDPKTGTCQPRSQAGEPCTYSPECQDGLYCDTAAGSCAPVKNLGDACTGPGCGWDAVCTNGVCTLYVVGEEVCVPATAASAGPQ